MRKEKKGCGVGRWKGRKARREGRKELYQFALLENYTRTNTDTHILACTCTHAHIQMHSLMCTYLHTFIHRDVHGTSFHIYPMRLRVGCCSCGIRSKSRLGQDGWAREQGCGNHAQCFRVGQKSKVAPRMAVLG